MVFKLNEEFLRGINTVMAFISFIAFEEGNIDFLKLLYNVVDKLKDIIENGEKGFNNISVSEYGQELLKRIKVHDFRSLGNIKEFINRLPLIPDEGLLGILFCIEKIIEVLEEKKQEFKKKNTEILLGFVEAMIVGSIEIKNTKVRYN